MNQKLSITSRIAVAFASGALIVVFFLPAWRIDLFAPQYPEGLTMNIWIHTITGDVDVINGLNHYIGMKHITVEMFPEFKYLPFVVGFFMLLGMIVAITGNKKFLFYYFILSLIGGALAIYDFYRWGYDYGHNLDPKAPIQVPGLSYQPPLIGHKRLLNFDAYSFPDVGGWVVMGAGLLASGILFFEWLRLRKTARIRKVVVAAFFIACTSMLSSCSAQPEPFKYGQDNCHFCKMGIVDPKFGAEIITKKGKIFKFDDVVCMSNFLADGGQKETDIKQKVVINFEKENDFLDINKSFFVVGPDIRSPMGSNAAAFANKAAAEKFNSGKNNSILDWTQMQSKRQ